jgi:putative membrane protein
MGSASCGKTKVEAARDDSTVINGQKILSLDDQRFLTGAEKMEIWQRTLALSALEKSENLDVRDFARRVVEDRNYALSELTALMNAKGITQPAAVLEEPQLEAANRLHRLSGPALDRVFLSLIAADQQQTVHNFDTAANTASDVDIRNYARNFLGSLQKDLDTALELQRTHSEEE